MVEPIKIGKRIKERREELGLTQEQIGARLKLNKSTIQRYETGKINTIKLPIIQAIAECLSVNPMWIICKTDIKNIDINSKPEKGKPITVPVLGSVAAGVPIEAIEDIVDYEELNPEQFNPSYDYFGLVIKGDSMQPRMQNGDVVIVRKQPTVETGDIAVVLVNGQDATVKKIRRREDGIELIPLNSNFEVMFYTNKEIQKLPVTIIGKVVELRAKF